MNFEKLTIKSQEVLSQAQRLAEERRHSEVDVEHLAAALIAQEEGVVKPLLARLGVSPATLATEIEAVLDRRAHVEGSASQRGISRGLKAVLDEAFEQAEKLQDEYVSVEHLLLAAIGSRGGDFARLAARHGLTPESVLKALSAVRGSQRVTDANPEDKYEALKK